MDRILTAPVVLLLITLSSAAQAQSVRGATIGFLTTVTTGESFGIKATVGESTLGLTENDLFKLGSGFLYVDSDGKIPDALEKDIGIPGEIPRDYELHQNYPNPFNPVTSILISIPRQSHTRLEVFNMLGQRMAMLVNEELSAGTHRYEWDATDVAGRPVSSGVYLYRLAAGDYVATQTMTLLK